MASGDAGEIIRMLENIQREIADLKRKLDSVERIVSTIKSRQSS